MNVAPMNSVTIPAIDAMYEVVITSGLSIERVTPYKIKQNPTIIITTLIQNIELI